MQIPHVAEQWQARHGRPIDEADVSAVAQYVIKKFDPSLAASKVLDPESDKAAACAELVTAVSKLADGVDKGELRNLMSIAPKLV